MFAELKRYRHEHGDCNVPLLWEENPKLASWVSRQRQFKREQRLSAEREARLNELGFVWNVLSLIGRPCSPN